MNTIHIDRLHIISDRAIGQREARSLGESFAAELALAVGDASGSHGRHLRVGDVQLELDGGAPRDAGVMRQAARSAARRILDRTPE